MHIYTLKLGSIIPLVVLVLFFEVVFNKKLLLTSNIDCLTRLDLNLPYYNSIYFLWTNLEYIYIYFIPLLFFLFFLSTRLSVTKNYTLLQLVVLVCTLWILSNNISTSGNIYAKYWVNNANLLLFNAINKYHPLLLYVPTLITILLPILFKVPKGFYKINKSNSSAYAYSIILVSLIFLTMYAGSWWAYQEGSWGGWWAWDSSETFGLLILLLLIGLLHFTFFTKKIKLLKYYILASCLFILTNYFLLQLNFGVTSHNFGLKDSSDSLFNSVYYSAVFISTLSLYGLITNLVKICVVNNNIRSRKSKIAYCLIILLLLILASLMPLITDLVWKVYKINIINFNHNYYLLSGLLVVSIVQWFFELKYFRLSMILFFYWVCLLTSNSSNLILVGFILTMEINKFYKLHLTIILFLFISWVSNSYLANYWLPSSNLLNNTITNTAIVKHPLIIGSTFNSLTESTYASMSNNSVPINSNTFFLSYASCEYQQAMTSFNNRVCLYTTTNDSIVFTLPLLYYTGNVTILRFISSSYIIKC